MISSRRLRITTKSVKQEMITVCYVSCLNRTKDKKSPRELISTLETMATVDRRLKASATNQERIFTSSGLSEEERNPLATEAAQEEKRFSQNIT